MKSITEGLPPELAKLVHPDVRANEAGYWAARDQLLAVYRDQWVAFAGGQVIASGRSPVEVFHQAQASGLHPFVTCVAHEDEPFRIRRASFPYDPMYPREPLPVVSIEVRYAAGSPGTVLDRV